jgi:hypothetical protein
MTLHKLLHLLPAFALVPALACKTDSEQTADSGSESTDGTTTAPTTTDATAATTSPTTGDTTDGTTTTATGTGTGTGGTDTDTDTAGPAGFCIGLDQIGSLGEVFEREGGNIGGNPSCDATPAGCGGDLVGTWNIEVICGFEDGTSLLTDYCPTATQTYTEVTSVGSITFVDDGSFTQSFETTQLSDVVTPAACFMASDCAGVQAGFSLLEGVSATCSGRPDACECEVTEVITLDMGGTYTVADNNVTLVTMDGMATAPYCVADDRMDLWLPLLDWTLTSEACNDETDCAAALGDAHEGYLCSASAGAAPPYTPAALGTIASQD